VLGATLSGAALGSQVGALAGSYVDQALFVSSGRGRKVEGPRLSDLQVTASTEGAAIPKIYGRARIGGQIIWATEIEEVAEPRRARASGKGSAAGGGRSDAGSTTTYSYSASFAVALCEGEIGGLGRVWANGTELDLSTVTHRVYTGSRSQVPDALIAAKLGASTPAYRDTAYVVFERLPLTNFGNRLPQLSFEVYRPVDPFAKKLRAVVMIPGSGEFVYEPAPVTTAYPTGGGVSENIHTRQGDTDWAVAMDQLARTLPNARSISLIVSWFGTDLRAGHCQLRPGVDRRDKSTTPYSWYVAGETRDTAHLVSYREGRPAYGGTPADASVVAAIRDLGRRGHRVTLTPFILMDVPEGNALPSPDGATPQPAYPWRGRITIDPAPGRPASPDKTPAAAVQLANFIGTAQPTDFALDGDAVVYTGPAEWSYRRLVLHYAMLAKVAGGVDAFLIGSELRGLTTARSAIATYPFVDALVGLASDVKAILGPSTKVTYAADWSEYFGHQPSDGSGDVLFHLDPLWASPAVDAIGIDVYWPLSDWREGPNHRDRLDGAKQIYDLDYLTANVSGGEGHDWYYASSADRLAQVRTPITDSLGKPWVFRFKDIKSWWREPHYNRIGGIEQTNPTAWLPQSKPIWFTELGCGAVDKGSNQPNLFVDDKSSENGLPYFSRGTRDDLIQRRYLQAFFEAFDPASRYYVDDRNPVSVVTGQRMVDLDRIYAYAFDARPFPTFPDASDIWGDGPNWRLGHWLNGRFANLPVGDLIAALLRDFDFDRFDVDDVYGMAAGYIVDRSMSAREALQPFELAYFIDALERNGVIAFRHRGASTGVVTIAEADLVESEREAPLSTLTRGQETDLPAAAKLKYLAAAGDYRQAVAESRRLVGSSGRLAQADLAIVLDNDLAETIADVWLHEAWTARERARFTLPPSMLAIEPGDAIALQTRAGERRYRVIVIADSGPRKIEALGFDPEIYGATAQAVRAAPPPPPVVTGQPLVVFLDLPLLTGAENPVAGYIAASQTPWNGAVAVYASPETTGYTLRAIADRAASVGVTMTDLNAAASGRFDRAAALEVRLAAGELASVSWLQMAGGANVAAVEGPGGAWEVIQFQTVELIAPSTYRLSGLLRGQAGTDADMAAEVAAGARFVVLDEAITSVNLTSAESRLPLTWRYGPSSRSIGDATYATTAHAFRAIGLRPLSPVHIRGRRSADGNLTLSWVRRTRIGGDDWNSVEVPLAEDVERYEVDILISGEHKRTLSAATPTCTYAAAEQIADFGALATQITIGVHQVSAVYGRGAAAVRTL
jgi:hypothetical protein